MVFQTVCDGTWKCATLFASYPGRFLTANWCRLTDGLTHWQEALESCYCCRSRKLTRLPLQTNQPTHSLALTRIRSNGSWICGFDSHCILVDSSRVAAVRQVLHPPLLLFLCKVFPPFVLLCPFLYSSFLFPFSSPLFFSSLFVLGFPACLFFSFRLRSARKCKLIGLTKCTQIVLRVVCAVVCYCCFHYYYYCFFFLWLLCNRQS